MRRTYTGSCHCGAVRFEADLDLELGTSRCNCSICVRGRFWKAIVPDEDFRLLGGEDALSEYRFGSGAIRHRFCSRCGVKPFGRGEMPELGGVFHAVNVACLEGIDPRELDALAVEPQDGREDRQDRAPAFTSYL
ncbi:GFA family protein [Luteimonas sp. SJ-92]|uniref:GFA family protein n=1 Tax=Luteimonas salinisoli TaxID=2752307 RepID=A0A853JAD3_9GAMM|nr:GFA family protein [Luteimonas salinisoli]NZA26143.1 GFA family protein [Luteimonas salinisoli]